MSDGFKIDFKLSEENIRRVGDKLELLISEVREMSKIINTSEQDWQGITKEKFVGKLQDTKQELNDFFNTTGNEYLLKEKKRAEEKREEAEKLEKDASNLGPQ